MNSILFWLTILLSAFSVVMLGVVLAKRLRLRRARAEQAAPAAIESGPASEQIFGSMIAAFGAQLPIPRSTTEELRKELRLAGYYRPTALLEFGALRFVLVTGACLVSGLLAVLLPAAATRTVLIGGLIAAGLGFSLPRVFLVAQGRRRLQKILRGLPDAVDLINMGVSRGLPFGLALERVQDQIREVHPEVSRELQIVQQQAQVGTLEQSLRQLEKRIDAPELRTLTGMLSQTERLGTSLSAALDTYAGSVRTSLKQNAERAASTAPFKLLFPIVLCMVPAIYMVLLGPAVLEISKFMRNRSQILNAPREAATRIGSEPITPPPQ